LNQDITKLKGMIKSKKRKRVSLQEMKQAIHKASADSIK
jgi:hypothetical protein